MSKLWESVLEGSFNTDDDMSTEVSAEIESVVTEEPETVVGYVADCTEGMIAIEAAMAMIEGECALKYATATDESVKASAKATMEGAINDAWETLKAWAKKAYAAIKKFIKKVWSKMKGYLNVFKAMVTKYSSVLKGKKIKGKIFSWVKVDMAGGAAALNKAMKDIDSMVKAEKDGGDTRPLAGNKGFQKELEEGFFPNPERRTPKEVEWTDISSEAIRTADDGFDKVYQQAFKLADTNEKDMIKDLKDAKGAGTKLGTKKTRMKVALTRAYATMVNTAASIQFKQSVAACRKAIRTQAESSSATFGVESSQFSDMLGEIL